MSGRSAGGVALLSLALACAQAQRSTSHGKLDVEWKGKESGSISGAATARWCELRRVLEIQSVRGDTGIALALYPGKSLVPGGYPVVDPIKAESLPPAAGIAVRWLGPSVIQGFQGDSGRVELKREPSGRLSGRLSARARSVVDTQRIVLAGTFQDLVVSPDTLGCAPPPDASDDDADPDDTGVH